MDGWTIFQAIGTWFGALGAIGALIFFARQTKSLAEQTESLIAQTKLIGTQTTSTMESFEFDSDWRRKDKAADLAKYYADSLVPRMSYCIAVLNESKAGAILSCLNTGKMKSFNLSELTRLLPNKLQNGNIQLERAVISCLSEMPFEAYEDLREILPEKYRLNIRNINKDTADSQKDFIVNEFFGTSSGLLNDLEYFSMCLICGIADEAMLYQSLHQMFFDTVEIFYFKIASINYDAKDKYFTHIIRLYSLWKGKYLGQIEKENSAETDITDNNYKQILK